MSQAAVSIILPTWNRLEYLRDAVASVLAQTRSDWELIVVDHGSTDESVRWLQSLSDPRIRVLELSHSGHVSRLRKIGIANSSASWIAFLDSDDAWHPEKLERQLAFHRDHPEYRWSYTAISHIAPDGSPFHRQYTDWPALDGDIVRALLLLEARIATPTVMVQRELIIEANGFNEELDFTEDYDLWLRIARIAQIGVVNERLAAVRHHEGSFTWDAPGVNRAFVRIFREFAATSSSPEDIRLCRQQQAHFGVRLARQHIARKEWRQGRAALADALRARPLYGPAWRAVGAGMWRALRSSQSKPA